MRQLGLDNDPRRSRIRDVHAGEILGRGLVPDSNEPHRPGLPEHHREHLTPRRTERHADANLPRPLRDDVRHDTVQPGGGQHQRHECERRNEHEVQTPWRHRIADQVAHRANGTDRELRIDACDRCTKERRDRRRVAARANHDRDRPLEPSAEIEERLMLRQKGGRIGVGVEPFVPGVADDADDFAPIARGALTDALPDRVLVRPVPARCRLVDDDDVALTTPCRGP